MDPPGSTRIREAATPHLERSPKPSGPSVDSAQTFTVIIFSGLGILVPLFYFGGIWLAGYVIDEMIFHQTGYYGAHLWAQFAGCAFVGALCYVFGHLLHRVTGREMIDPKAGKVEIIGGFHSFFFIPMQWWSFFFVALGLFLWIHG